MTLSHKHITSILFEALTAGAHRMVGSTVFFLDPEYAGSEGRKARSV